MMLVRGVFKSWLTLVIRSSFIRSDFRRASTLSCTRRPIWATSSQAGAKGLPASSSTGVRWPRAAASTWRVSSATPRLSFNCRANKYPAPASASTQPSRNISASTLSVE